MHVIKDSNWYGYYPMVPYTFWPEVVIGRPVHPEADYQFTYPLKSGCQFASLPKGSYLVTHYTRSVMSCIVGVTLCNLLVLLSLYMC